VSDPLIVNVALTGCVHRKADVPALPEQPGEVAACARRCADQGASVFHVHARDAAGNPLWGREAYKIYVDAVRAAVPGAVVCASTSGRHHREFHQRAAAVGSGADLASLTLGSVDFRDATSLNPRYLVEGLARLMREHGAKPECEAFDLSHAHRLAELREAGLIDEPLYVNVVLGVLLPAEPRVLSTMLDAFLEAGIVWSATGVGRAQFAPCPKAMAMGGHVRVGLEDSARGEPLSNPEQVARAVAVGRALGREPATPKEARRMLGLDG
jgi:uncharacterized protein (DUF849 family)